MPLVYVSGLEEEYTKKKDKKIVIGNWVVDENIANENFSTNEFFFNSEEKILEFNKYISCLHKKISKNLQLQLNKIHNVNYELKAWQIILDPWLTYYLENNFFRWKLIEGLIEKNDELQFIKFNKLNYDTLFDQNEFNHLISSSSTYNHFFFQKIFSFYEKKSTKIKVINIDKEIPKINNYNYIINDKKISIFKKIYESIIKYISKNSEIYLGINCGARDYLKLCIYLKKIPFKGDSFFLRKNLISIFNLKNTINLNLRKKIELNLDKSIDFENFLSENLFLDLPQIFIEKFQHIKSIANKIPIHPKIILSDIQHIHNTIFKFWIMKSLNQNIKLILSDHGGTYGIGKRAIQFEDDVSYKSIKWHKPIKNNDIQLPVLHLLKYKNYRFKTNKRTKLLLISHDTFKYPKYFSIGPIANQTLKQLFFIKNFSSNLNNEINKNLFVRPYLAHNDWKINEKLKDCNIKAEQVLNKNNDFRLCMKQSRLIVATYPRTAFYESLISGPTILLYESKFYREHKSLSVTMDELKKNKIVFEDPKEAAIHINQNWGNLYQWWNSKDTIEARNSFFTNLALYEDNPFPKWKEFFEKNL